MTGNGLACSDWRRNHAHVGSRAGAGGLDPVHMAGGVGRDRKPQRIGEPTRSVSVGSKFHSLGICICAAAAVGIVCAVGLGPEDLDQSPEALGEILERGGQTLMSGPNHTIPLLPRPYLLCYSERTLAVVASGTLRELLHFLEEGIARLAEPEGTRGSIHVNQVKGSAQLILPRCVGPVAVERSAQAY